MTLLMVHKVLEQTSVPTYRKHPGCREGAGHLTPAGLPRAEFWPLLYPSRRPPIGGLSLRGEEGMHAITEQRAVHL